MAPSAAAYQRWESFAGESCTENTCYTWPLHASLQYYLSSLVTAHSGWSTGIANEMYKWNNVPYAHNPSWSRTTTYGTEEMYVGVAASISQCGEALPTSYYGSGTIKTLLRTQFVYNQNKNYATDCNGFSAATLHELGHAAEALGHTRTTVAVMHVPAAPPGYTSLQSDDVQGIQAYYP